MVAPGGSRAAEAEPDALLNDRGFALVPAEALDGSPVDAAPVEPQEYGSAVVAPYAASLPGGAYFPDAAAAELAGSVAEPEGCTRDDYSPDVPAAELAGSVAEPESCTRDDYSPDAVGERLPAAMAAAVAACSRGGCFQAWCRDTDAAAAREPGLADSKRAAVARCGCCIAERRGVPYFPDRSA